MQFRSVMTCALLALACEQPSALTIFGYETARPIVVVLDAGAADVNADAGFTLCGPDDPFLVERFGARANDAIDDSDAIARSISVLGEAHLGPGRYLEQPHMTDAGALGFLSLASDQKLIGCPSSELAILRAPISGNGDLLLSIRDAKNVVLRGITLRASQDRVDERDPPSWAQRAVEIDSSQNVLIEDNRFVGFDFGVTVGSSANLSRGVASHINIEHNVFLGNGPRVTNGYDVNISASVRDASVAHNVHRSGQWFAVALIPTFGRGPSGPGDATADTFGISIVDNDIKGYRAYGILVYQDYVRTNTYSQLTISKNRIRQIFGDVIGGAAGAGIYFAGNGQALISENEISDVNLLTSHPGHAPAAIASVGTSKMQIVKNTIRGAHWFGISSTAPPFAKADQEILIEENTIEECRSFDGGSCGLDLIWVNSNSGVQIKKNQLFTISHSGISLFGSQLVDAGTLFAFDLLVDSNSIVGSGPKAIQIVDAKSVHVIHNTTALTGEGWGSVQVVRASDVVIEHSVFDQRDARGAYAALTIDAVDSQLRMSQTIIHRSPIAGAIVTLRGTQGNADAATEIDTLDAGFSCRDVDAQSALGRFRCY
jgi:Right handed beta helix region